MNYLLNSPLLVLTLSLVTLWLSELIGASFRKRRNLQEDERDGFNLIAAATLTLLGLIIGFAFSMAISGYDQRQSYEEAEANAIATEYNLSDLLPDGDAARVRALLRDYLDQRVLFYETYNDRQLRQIDETTAHLKTGLWSAVKAPAVAQPSPVVALAVSGMNDVLNSKGNAQAAWWNRVPGPAWGLMAAIAICSNLLVGYGLRNPERKATLLLVLPIVVSISFFLISDIDSPRGGIIHVSPQNLTILSRSLHGR
jgi:hypothetical protein